MAGRFSMVGGGLLPVTGIGFYRELRGGGRSGLQVGMEANRWLGVLVTGTVAGLSIRDETAKGARQTDLVVGGLAADLRVNLVKRRPGRFAIPYALTGLSWLALRETRPGLVGATDATRLAHGVGVRLGLGLELLSLPRATFGVQTLYALQLFGAPRAPGEPAPSCGDTALHTVALEGMLTIRLPSRSPRRKR